MKQVVRIYVKVDLISHQIDNVHHNSSNLQGCLVDRSMIGIICARTEGLFSNIEHRQALIDDQHLNNIVKLFAIVR